MKLTFPRYISVTFTFLAQVNITIVVDADRRKRMT